MIVIAIVIVSDHVETMNSTIVAILVITAITIIEIENFLPGRSGSPRSFRSLRSLISGFPYDRCYHWVITFSDHNDCSNRTDGSDYMETRLNAPPLLSKYN